MTDFDLDRFVTAQDEGLGHSPTARAFALASLDEARAYLAHPVLGPRLRECADALLGLESGDAVAVLGSIDALKLRSSMTLFARADRSEDRFPNLLRKFYAGAEDEATVTRLR